LASSLLPTFRYWSQTEVHVYAFSIAANVLLSFFPFIVVMVTLSRYVLPLHGLEAAIFLALGDYFPDALVDFIRRNLRFRGPLQFVSIFLLFFTANGIFEPLEVALNKAWGITKNRSFLRNQILSLILIFICGALALFSTALTAVNETMLAKASGLSKVTAFMSVLFFKAAAIPMSILMLFLIYWLLPNRKLPARIMILPAIVIGLTLELLKYVNVLTWPWFRVKLEHEYGPFQYSVAILLWSFVAALVILAGAEWTARRCPETDRIPIDS
jgi:membrane protein